MYDKDKAKEIYYKIDRALQEKKIKRYQFANMIGLSGQRFCELLSDLKKGNVISLEHLKNIGNELKINFNLHIKL